MELRPRLTEVDEGRIESILAKRCSETTDSLSLHSAKDEICELISDLITEAFVYGMHFQQGIDEYG